MGGYGSTRWGWQRTRDTTDPYLWLDVRLLARWGALAPAPGRQHRGRGAANHPARSITGRKPTP